MRDDRAAYVGSWRLTRNPRLGSDSGVFFAAAVHTAKEQAGVILDVGCGRGYVSDDLNPEPNIFDLRGPDRRVVGIDIDIAGKTNPLLDEFRLIPPSGTWPVDSESCDIVMSDWTLEHVDDPARFTHELARVLKPGGLVVARSVNATSLLSLVSRIVPNSKHARVLAEFQPARQVGDIFPVRYRMNSRPALRRLLKDEFEWTVVNLPGMASYLPTRPRLSRVVHWCESRFPSRLQTVLVVIARKRV